MSSDFLEKNFRDCRASHRNVLSIVLLSTKKKRVYSADVSYPMKISKMSILDVSKDSVAGEDSLRHTSVTDLPFGLQCGKKSLETDLCISFSLCHQMSFMSRKI